MSSLIQFQNVSRTYPSNITALSDINISIEQGELVFLSGASGAGKSTLLKMIAGIECPDTGSLKVNDQEIGHLDVAAIPFLRRNIGLILQQQVLLHNKTVLENVMLPLIVTETNFQEATERATAALKTVALSHRINAFPLTLSEGEQQRVSVARAIVNRPQLILADEPTANLDKENAKKVMQAIMFFQTAGVTSIIATHDDQFFNLADKIIFLDKGKVVHIEKPRLEAKDKTNE